jgi:Skp family chaperone for outer membrane proteins
VVLAVGAAFVAGVSVPGPVAAGPKEEAGKAAGPKIGIFNMAKVMKEYRRAEASVAELNDSKVRKAANLKHLRDMLADLEASKRGENVQWAGGAYRNFAVDMFMLTRLVKETENAINRQINDDASAIIGKLYDEMHAVVSEMAREHGLVAVFSYPDAVTEEERNNPYIKEMKLKPPAAYPFSFNSSLDYTGEIIKRLNAR